MIKVLPIVPSLKGHKNYPEAVPVIAEMPLALPSLEGHGKLRTTGTTVWFTVEYCQSVQPLHGLPIKLNETYNGTLVLNTQEMMYTI